MDKFVVKGGWVRLMLCRELNIKVSENASLTDLKFGSFHVPLRAFHFETGPFVLDKVEDARNGILAPVWIVVFVVGCRVAATAVVGLLSTFTLAERRARRTGANHRRRRSPQLSPIVRRCRIGAVVHRRDLHDTDAITHCQTLPAIHTQEATERGSATAASYPHNTFRQMEMQPVIGHYSLQTPSSERYQYKRWIRGTRGQRDDCHLAAKTKCYVDCEGASEG